jgi:uncharacterized membrane protein (DUF485 family)
MFKRENQQKSPQKRFLFILGSVMFVFYFVLGLTILFWEDIPLNLSKTYRIVFGSFLIMYSFLRMVRLIQTRRDED